MLEILQLPARVIRLARGLLGATPVVRSPEAQAEVDKRARALILYELAACPYCQEVRRAVRRLNLNIETRDVRSNKTFGDELTRGGGKLKVPCLKIAGEDGSVQWLYESSDIVRFLYRHFGG